MIPKDYHLKSGDLILLKDDIVINNRMSLIKEVFVHGKYKSYYIVKDGKGRTVISNEDIEKVLTVEEALAFQIIEE